MRVLFQLIAGAALVTGTMSLSRAACQTAPLTSSTSDSLATTTPGGSQRKVLTHKVRLTPERIRVTTSTVNVPLGSPFEVTVDIAPGEVFGVLAAVQSTSRGIIESGAANVVDRKGTHYVISVTPIELGAVDLTVGLLYDDGGYAEQILHLNVTASSKGLKKFSLGVGGSLSLLLGTELQKQGLRPVATYENLLPDIYFHSLEPLSITVAQPETNPVIRLDERGFVHGLRPGTATIEATFAGATDHVAVKVSTAPPGYTSTSPPPIHRIEIH